jgi:hypothetical protein
MTARVAFAALALVCSLSAQVPVVSTILNNGPTSNRYDLVLLGDGYTAAEQTRFDQDCQTYLAALLVHQPYQTYAAWLNVHTVFRPSLMSGANHPDLIPPIVNNPVYGSAYNYAGVPTRVYINNLALALADAALAPANEGRFIVLVNDNRYGGATNGQFACGYNGSALSEVAIHEMGHLLGLLADEYETPYGQYMGPEPVERNATTLSSGNKWSHWWGYNGCGSVQGCRYYLTGLYRPCQDCLMRSLNQPYCPVCTEQIMLALGSVVSTVDQPYPSTINVSLGTNVQQLFSFNDLVPGNSSQITWTLDNVTVPGATGSGYTLATGGMALGGHVLQVTVQDPTPFVRLDPAHVMRDTFTWNVAIVDPNASDLQLQSLLPATVTAAAGQTITVTTTVHNGGPGSSPSCQVDHFLSQDAVLDANDLWLGGYTLPALVPNGNDVNVRQIELPHVLTAGNWHVLAVVDRTNQVPEPNEGNNTGSLALTALAPPCTPALEYRDPMVWPRNEATASIAYGETLLPTVVAPCAAPGSLYLLALSASGTVPGTTIAPGITVPLNQDALTVVGLANVNGPVFQQFMGVLDAQGMGRATIAWPPSVHMRQISIWLAAVLIDAMPHFTATTNAIRLDFQ